MNSIFSFRDIEDFSNGKLVETENSFPAPNSFFVKRFYIVRPNSIMQDEEFEKLLSEARLDILFAELLSAFSKMIEKDMVMNTGATENGRSKNMRGISGI